MSRSTRVSAQDQSRERGTTLLFAVGILALLAMFSVVFTRLMSLERRASAYYADRVSAKLAARAGIEHAIVNLQASAGERHWSDPWQDRWGYRLVKPPALQPGQRVDLQTTSLPSYSMLDPKGRRRLGEPMRYSGSLGEPYAGSLLVYRLKVLDSASMVNLNQPDGLAARRMLTTLIRNALPARAGEAAQIARKVVRSGRQRPNRFESKPQIGKALMEAGITEEEWLGTLRDLVTVHSWEDPTVIRPWNLNSHEPSDAGDPPFRPLQRLTTMPRAPINLNTASEPVLTALFSGVTASTRYGKFSLDETTAQQLAAAIVQRRGGPPAASTPGVTRERPLSGSVAPSGFAFTPFRSWPEFEKFVDELPDEVFASCPADLTPLAERFPGGQLPSGLPAKLAWPWPKKIDFAPSDGFFAQMQKLHKVGHRDLVKAVCNPNTMINKFGQMPNHGGYKGLVPRMVDKSDLVSMTTEACFDSLGVYEITSVGMILLADERTDVDMEVIAAHTDQMVVQVYRPLRLTTQQDFEAHRAVMIAGNFIDAPEAMALTGQQKGAQMLTYESFRRSINQSAFFENDDATDYQGNPMPVPGWPGMVSWPQYSLDRDGTRADFAPKEHYPMADWDGHLTLSNMITVRTGDSDFIAGFARGRLDAFKARAWWEPRDIQPDSRFKTKGALGQVPTRPFPAGEEIDPLPAGYLNELERLTRPLTGHPPDLDAPFTDPDSRSVRVRSAVNPAEASLLGEDLSVEVPTGGGTTTTQPTEVNGGSLFTRGSQLLNTGVLIAPDRVDDAGNPRFLAYDGDNIDLVKGTTIRFWVQPLRDPFAQKTEVLLSFVGSNGAEPGNAFGKKREVGFRVYKEADGGEVNIVLEAIGTPGLHGPSDVTDWSSALADDVSRVRIPVTPNPNNPVNEPTRPQWIPGTWHWVAINVGLGYRGSDADKAPGFHYYATIQVDKSRPSPELVFRGDDWGTSNAAEFGELYGHVFVEASSAIEPINRASANRSFPDSRIQRFWYRPRVLGDFYHCQKYADASRAAPSAGSGPVDPPYRHTSSDFGPGVVVVHKTREFGAPPSSPAVVYAGADHTYFPFDATGTTPGTYIPTAEYPQEPHPILSFNRKLKLRFYLDDGSGERAPGVPDIDMELAEEDNPGYVDLYGSTTRAKGVKRGQWFAKWPASKHEVYGPDAPYRGSLPAGVQAAPPLPGFLRDKGYPGGKEWHISVVAEWDEAHYLAGSQYGNEPVDGPRLRINGITTALPVDPTTLPGVEEPDPKPAGYLSNGEGLPYSVHNSGQTTKGAGTAAKVDGMTITMHSALWENPQNNRRSYVRTKQDIPRAQGVSLSPIPLDLIDDDCHGCEDCDVDGPVFIGGEPALHGYTYADNYESVTGKLRIAPVDESTMAYAVFDNIVFLNGDHARRTDAVGSTDDTPLFEEGAQVNLAAKNFEDRFYEEDLEAYLLDVSAKLDETHEVGTGAVYHRALMELRNTRVRLGSMTWTSYSTSYDLGLEVGLWKFRNTYDPLTGRYRYSYLRRDPDSGQRLDMLPERDVPQFGRFLTSAEGGVLVDGAGAPQVRFQHDAERGIVFSLPHEPRTGFAGTRAFLDGLGSPADPDSTSSLPQPQELLILGVRLQELGEHTDEDGLVERVDVDPTNPDYQDYLASGGSVGVIQSPVVETPILEDVTLNVLPGRPVIIYAEEGAAE